MKTIPRILALALYALSLLTTAHAASTPVSGLPAASSVSSTNLTIVVDTTESNPSLQTKKATINQLVDGLPAASAGAKGTMSAADKTKLDGSTASATASTLVSRDSSANTAFNLVTMVQGTVTNPPLNANDIANKGYVDSAAAGLSVKAPCKAATTANVTLAGGAPTVVDGITLLVNDRVLVWNQTDAKENGLYYVSVLGSGANGTWVRTTDADTGAELVTGSYTFVTQGTVSGNSSYVMTTAGTIVIGTSNIVWTLYTQVTNILAANIIGQLISSQIADAAISTAKFASGITPVEVLGTLPVSSNFAGRTVFLTSDAKLYRYDGASFISTTAAADVTGQITTTQITDSSVTTAKVAANAITAAKIAAGTITANEIAADTITAGQIAAGAINTSELAASAVTAAKILSGSITTTQIAASTILGGNIAAGTITASNLSVSTLSAITANLGTVTAGTISGVSITTTSGAIAGFTLASNSFSSGSGVNSVLLESTLIGPTFRLGASSATAAVVATAGNLQLRNNSGGTAVTLDGTGGSGLITARNSGASVTITLTGSSGNVSATTGTFSGAVSASSYGAVSATTGVFSSTVSTGDLTAGDIHLGTGGANKWLYDGSGNRLLQQRYSGSVTTLSDVIGVLQYHGLIN
jgi:hypothetical protein